MTRARLDSIGSPADLRELQATDLPALATELRAFLIDSVSRTGGHLAAGLGVVELTLALHYVFDTPDDRIVWDVGHQSYPHKVLTGRREAMAGLRQAGGLAGFPRREESEYDTFGTGHSSTGISAALGMALGMRLTGIHQETVAVVGDGALTAGEAFEGLAHAADSGADLLIVLNDNGMSISPNEGGIAQYLSRLAHRVVNETPGLRSLARARGGGNIFEALGFDYTGPVDGHDVSTLVQTLRTLRRQRGPRLLHILTRKGQGYAPAEAAPCKYHGVKPFNPAKGMSGGGGSTPTFSQVFGTWLCDTASQDSRLVAITPAMCEGSGLEAFRERYPDRYFDPGITEQHCVTLAGGLACEGLKPVLAIYSTFLQRGYDQWIHDIALQRLPVTLAIDRAGLVGEDGPTHAGSYDLVYLRCLPGMTIMTPSDEAEARAMLNTALTLDGPSAVRYPKGTGTGIPAAGLETLPVGRGRVIREGDGIALLVFGTLLAQAREAAERLGATVADMRFVKPLDTELVERLAGSHRLLVTIEEGAVQGGAGSAINEHLAAAGLNPAVLNLGLPDRFIPHGSRSWQLRQAGLHSDGLEAAIRNHPASQRPPQPERANQVK